MTRRAPALARAGFAAALLSGAVLAAAASPATATGTSVSGTITASSAPSIPSTGTGLAAGSLTVTIGATAVLSGDLILSVTPTRGTGAITWHGFSVTVTGSAANATANKHLLNIQLTKTSGTSTRIVVSGISYTTVDALGEADVTATLPGVTFASATTNAVLYQTPPVAPSFTVTASSQPQLSAGEADGSASTWTVTMTGNSTLGSGWTAADVLTLTVAPPQGANCQGAAYVYFVGTPSVSVTASSGVSVTPAAAVSLAAASPCSGAEPDQLRLELTNTGHFDQTSTGSVSFVVSALAYAVGSTGGEGTGDVHVSGAFSVSPSSVTTAGAANADITAAASGGVGGGGGGASGSSGTPTFTVSADTPPVTTAKGRDGISISPIVVTESTAGSLPGGYACASLSGAYFDTASAPDVEVSVGGVSTGSLASFVGGSSTAAPTVELTLSAASSATARYEVTGLVVDVTTAVGPALVTVSYGPSADCTGDTTAVGSATVVTVVGTEVVRVYGSTADATAAAELEYQFDADSTACPGRIGSRPVVLATDAGYADALASAYLAGYLQTGELLTSPDVLSTPAANAIRTEGITSVYVVGGPLAVSTAVVDAIESMPVYGCGGGSPVSGAQPAYVQVTRIYGDTAYDTSQWIAEFPNPSTVGSIDVAGAYAKASTGRSGLYDDAGGDESAAPSNGSPLPTAIVATGSSFEDAESASVLSYAEHLPILLTTSATLSPDVASATADLGIKQVIVMGGPLAVSDAVVTSLEALGLAVLRVAGHDASDTAVQLADFEMAPSSGNSGLGWKGSGAVTVARGDSYSDGLAGAIVAAGAGRTHVHDPEPLVLTESPTAAGPYLSGLMSQAGRTGIDAQPSDKVTSMTVLGGPDALTAAAVQQLTGDL